MTTAIQEIDYSRKWLIMTTVGMGIFLATIDSSIVNVALPTLVSQFDTKFALVQWVVLAYLLTLATLMLTVGRLGDIVGKKPIYASGMVIFTVASFLCGVESSIYGLIGFRILQGIGAAMMIALGTGILTEAFPPSERGKAMGMAGAFVSIGIIVGPTIGGILIEALSWHWIFFVNIPVGIIGTYLVIRFLPGTRIRKNQRFDYLGAITLFLSLSSFLLALTLGQQAGFTSNIIIILVIAWLIFFLFFLLIELRVDQPMVELRLFRNELFSLNLLTGFISFVCLGGTIILMPFYLENVLKYDPRQVGFLLAVVPLAAGFTSPLSGHLSDRTGTRLISSVGLLILVGGYLGLTTLSSETTTLGYVLRFLPIGLGVGIFQSPNNSAIMGTAPRERLGIVSSLLSITRTLGQSSGIAAIGAFWFYRVSQYAGTTIKEGATRTSASDQINGLQDTFVAISVLMILALILNVWSYIKEKVQIQKNIGI
jgi:EmrB/QacA subfamily drug resistance transporter